MKITVAKKDMLRMVSLCQGVVDKKGTMPVLANVLVVADGSSVRVYATDLGVAVSGETKAEVKQAGSVAIPARDLFERLKMMPEGSVTISVAANGSVEVKSDTSPRRYKLFGLSGDNFPAIPQPSSDSPMFELKSEALSALINATQFSISADESRPHLNSALFELDGGKARMVTTDGHRLTKMELALEGGQTNVATMLIPSKAIAELRKLAEEAHGQSVRVSLAGPNAFFVFDDTCFCLKLVEATFPAYQQVIPTENSKNAVAPRKQLVDALRAVAIAANGKTGGVKMSFQSGTLQLSGETPDSGEGFDEIPVDYRGKPITIGFNAKYVLDALGAMQDEEVSMQMSEDLDPMVVTSAVEDTAKTFVGVLMPMRI